MFYAHFVLSKKGPLARIWLAAHWDKKVTKAHVYETDIVSSVAAILEPKLKMALRTSGHLLLGVVRIYSRKAKYLLADCNEAYLKIKMAFRPGLVDLPEENREAALAAITLPDALNVDFDMHLLDADFDIPPAASSFFELELPSFSAPTDSQQARVDDITMVDSSAISRPLRRAHDEDDFGDAGFFASEMQPRVDIELARADQPRSSALSGDASDFARESTSIALDERTHDASTKRKDTADVHSLLLDASDADFGDAAAMLGISSPGGARVAPITAVTTPQSRIAVVDEFGDEQFGGFIADDLGAANTADLFGDASAVAADHTRDALATLVEEPEVGSEQQNALNDETESAAQNLNAIIAGATIQPRTTQVNVLNATRAQNDETTLVPNASEAFVLEPQAVNTTMQIVAHRAREGPRSIASSATGTTHTRATTLGTGSSKRKRRLIVDEQKSIPSDAMKAQMQVTTDIVTTLELAPPTKRLMFWKEFGTADRLVAQPAAPNRSVVFARTLDRSFARRLVVSRWSNWHDGESQKRLPNEDVDSVSGLAEKRAREDANIEMIELTDASDVEIEHVHHDATLNGAAFDPHEDLFASLENPDLSIDTPAPVETTANFTKPFSPIRPPVEEEDEEVLEAPNNAPLPTVYDESIERMAMSAVASEGLEAGEQAFLGKKVLAFYGELQQLATTSTSTPRSTRRGDAAAKQSDAPISFLNAARRATRKQAANKFLALLFLLKQGCVSVEQDAAYSDIAVRLVQTGTSGRASHSHSHDDDSGTSHRRNEHTGSGSSATDSRSSSSLKQQHAVANAHSRATNHSRASYATCASPTSTASALSINMQRNASSLTIQ